VDAPPGAFTVQSPDGMSWSRQVASSQQTQSHSSLVIV
jgi:hypothetical protein